MPESLQFQQLSLEAKQIELHVGPVIDTFTLKSGEARIEADPFRLHLHTAAHAEARLSQASIAAYLEKESPGGLKEFSVESMNGHLTVRAKAKIIMEIPVTAICRLKIEQEKRLMVELVSVEVMGGSAKSLVEAQLAKINPILDASDLPVPLRLTEVRCENGWVILTGTADQLSFS